jgi:hypothetical protein
VPVYLLHIENEAQKKLHSRKNKKNIGKNIENCGTLKPTSLNKVKLKLGFDFKGVGN